MQIIGTSGGSNEQVYRRAAEVARNDGGLAARIERSFIDVQAPAPGARR